MPDDHQTEPAIRESAGTTPAQGLAETIPGPPRTVQAGEAICPELMNHPRYQIMRMLGRGGMGTVYQAIHRVMERPVALKIMRCELINNPAAVDRFRREVRAAAQLVHPNIVTAYDAEQFGEWHFLVMEYVEGRTLAEIVAAEGPLPVAVATDFIIQVAQGLQHALEKGMIHRDIKPQNLMVADSGRRILDWNPDRQTEIGSPRMPIVKILDFGLARFAGDEAASNQTASGMILGTVDFMAPEQADNARAADIRSDIYSLGCTFFYLLSGRVLFPEGTVIQRVMAHVNRQPPSLDTLRPGLPAGLTSVVRKMLAKDPADRYQTPAEVIAALTPFRSTGNAPVLEPTVALLAPTVEKPVEEVLEAIPVSPSQSSNRRSRAESVDVASAPREPSRSSRTLLGCFLLAALSIVGVIGLGAYGIWLIVDRISSGVEKLVDEAKKQAQAWEKVERNFEPLAADVSNENLFPNQLAGHPRQVMDTQASIKELNIEQPGRHAVFGKGNNEVHVFAYHPIAKLEKEAIFSRALRVADETKKENTGGWISVTGTAQTNRLTMHLDRSGMFGEKIRVRAMFWWNQGWLFVVRSPLSVDPEPIMMEYLQWLDESQNRTDP